MTSLGLKLQLLFGGRRNQIGWFLLAVGLLAAVHFIGQSEILTAPRFWTTLSTTTGRIERVEPTNAHEGRRRSKQIQAVHYGFELHGVPYHGTSYTLDDRIAPGRTVEIEYVAERPHVSRIRRMRSAPFSSSKIFALVIPLVALAIVVPGLRKGAREIALLQRGVLTEADVEPHGAPQLIVILPVLTACIGISIIASLL